MKKTRTQKHYNNVVVEDLVLMYNCQNIMQLPKMNRAVLSTSSKSSLFDKQVLLNGFATCFLLSGQASKLTRARKSVAAFQLRKGSTVGCMVTIRGNKMYALLDKIVSFVLPRLQNQSVEYKARPLTGHAYVTPETCLSQGHPVQSGSDWFKKKEQRDVNFGIPEATLFPEIESLLLGGSFFKKKTVVAIPAVDELLTVSLAKRRLLPAQKHKASIALASKAECLPSSCLPLFPEEKKQNGTRHDNIIAPHQKAQVSKNSVLVHPIHKQTFSSLQGLNILFSFCTHRFHYRRSFADLRKVGTNQANCSKTLNKSNRVFMAAKAAFVKGKVATSKGMPHSYSWGTRTGVLAKTGVKKTAPDIRIEKWKDLLFLSAFQCPMHC